MCRQCAAENSIYPREPIKAALQENTVVLIFDHS